MADNQGQTYQLEPEEQERFHPSKVKKVIEKVLTENLKNKVYESNEGKDMAIRLTDLIRQRVKAECQMPRYKLAVQVVYGEIKGQSLRVTSKCLWDSQFDNYASFSFNNESLYCVGIVFGTYCE